MKFLFLKKTLAWPRASGHDVHTFYLAQALAKLGHSIGLALVVPCDAKAIDDLPLELGLHRLAHSPVTDFGRPDPFQPPPSRGGLGGVGLAGTTQAKVQPRPSCLQRRFLRYWGIEPAWIAGARELVARLRPDVVVASGFDLVPCLSAVHGPQRIWYIADEYARHHLTMLQLRDPATWRHFLEACISAAYEYSYANCYDRAWVVSRDEAVALRWLGGARAVDVVVNGVDGDWFAPGNEPTIPQSCVFWGRLDSRPNIQALEWFCREIWPRVRRLAPDAKFSILGFAPTDAIRALAGDGVSIIADAPDIRPEVRRHEIAVMPFVSGGGIKNKLLEAAALGMPIVAMPQGCSGLGPRRRLPIAIAVSPEQWVRTLIRIWNEPPLRAKLGAEARSWVLQRHTWKSAAAAALAGLQRERS